jgi:hypothetical protein
MVDVATFERWLSGERPPNIPEHWVGSPTRTSEGYRWDDPADAGNSMRMFRGDPGDSDPAHREPFVIMVRGGQVLDVNAEPINDPEIVAHALTHE